MIAPRPHALDATHITHTESPIPDVTLDQLAARLAGVERDTARVLFALEMKPAVPPPPPTQASTPVYSATHSAPNPDIMTAVPASWEAGLFVRRTGVNERLQIIKPGDVVVYCKGVRQDMWIPVDALELVP